MQGHHSLIDVASNGVHDRSDQQQQSTDLSAHTALSPVRTKPEQSAFHLKSQLRSSDNSAEQTQPLSLAESARQTRQLSPRALRLSPRASLDLSLHPEHDGACIVRIVSDPPDAMYHEPDQDTVIEDPTLVAVLEHAVWHPNAHPVFHVPMPVSRRASQYGDTESEADDSCLSPARSARVDGHHLSQPLLSNGHHTDAGKLLLAHMLSLLS